MAATSFHEILMDFLEENEPVSPLKTQDNPAFSLETEPFFPLKFVTNSKTQPRLHSVYPAPPKRIRSAKTEKPQREPEWIVALSKLESADLALVEEWTKLGAYELKEGISRERLKSAHRRFVKLYHPDRDASLEARERFLKAQCLYEKLARALDKYKTASADGCETSDSARDSECASAEGYRHPNAA